MRTAGIVFAGLVGMIGFGCSNGSGHPCASVALTAPWTTFPQPAAAHAVCQSTPDKLQIHVAGATADVTTAYVSQLDAQGYHRDSQELAADASDLTISKDGATFAVSIYQWDGGTGIVVKPAQNQ